MQDTKRPSLQDMVSAIVALRHDVDRHEKQVAQLLSLVQKCAETSEQNNRQDSWLPPVDFSAAKSLDFLAFRQSLRQIPKVEKPQNETVDRLKATWLGRVYVSQLKRHRALFWLVNWIWAHTYPPYVRFVAVHLNKDRTKRWLPLTKQTDFARARGITPFKLVDAAVVETPTPAVFPAGDQGYLVTPHDRYNFPPIFVAEIGEGMIYGGTNLVLTKDAVVCHDLYDFERDYTSEELHGRTLIDPGKNRLRWLVHDDSPERLPAAAAFVDACASNYAHWLTEVLPRIAAFCAEEQFKHIPIVVNDGLHDNIMESLFVVAGREREIVTLPIGRALQVDALYLTSVVGYVPFERRNSKLSGHSHGVFSPSAFELIRNKVTSIAERLPEQPWPEKIYLRRNSGGRKVTNAAALHELLLAQGYVIVEPEKLTFMQQVQLFQNAKQVVAPTGAALANAVFCKPGTRIGVLMAKHENMIYGYWLNMLAPLQIEVAYLLGSIDANHDLGIHGDFFINSIDVIDYFESEKNK